MAVTTPSDAELLGQVRRATRRRSASCSCVRPGGGPAGGQRYGSGRCRGPGERGVRAGPGGAAPRPGAAGAFRPYLFVTVRRLAAARAARRDHHATLAEVREAIAAAEDEPRHRPGGAGTWSPRRSPPCPTGGRPCCGTPQSRGGGPARSPGRSVCRPTPSPSWPTGPRAAAPALPPGPHPGRLSGGVRPTGPASARTSEAAHPASAVRSRPTSPSAPTADGWPTISGTSTASSPARWSRRSRWPGTVRDCPPRSGVPAWRRPVVRRRGPEACRRAGRPPPAGQRRGRRGAAAGAAGTAVGVTIAKVAAALVGVAGLVAVSPARSRRRRAARRPVRRGGGVARRRVGAGGGRADAHHHPTVVRTRRSARFAHRRRSRRGRRGPARRPARPRCPRSTSAAATRGSTSGSMFRSRVAPVGGVEAQVGPAWPRASTSTPPGGPACWARVPWRSRSPTPARTRWRAPRWSSTCHRAPGRPACSAPRATPPIPR